MTATKPPVHELDFLKLTSNHLELSRKLNTLSFQNPLLSQHAEYVGKMWFDLGENHLNEAKSMLRLKNKPHRAIFSRSYYAAYNASKCIRYLTAGFVSLTGEDHGKATDLPKDFPDKEKWAKNLATLYENRLRADYDNWTTTAGEFSETSSSAVDSAENFIVTARAYINNKIGSNI